MSRSLAHLAECALPLFAAVGLAFALQCLFSSAARRVAAFWTGQATLTKAALACSLLAATLWGGGKADFPNGSGGEVDNGTDPDNPDDGVHPPDASELLVLPFHVYGDYAAWEMTVAAVANDTRTFRIATNIPGQADTRSLKFRMRT